MTVWVLVFEMKMLGACWPKERCKRKCRIEQEYNESERISKQKSNHIKVTVKYIFKALNFLNRKREEKTGKVGKDIIWGTK